MQKEVKQHSTRRKFLFLGISAAAFYSFFRFAGTGKKARTIKMLTEDGRLVELNEDLLPSKRKKVSDKELQGWVKK
jgi:hypothetical protein